MEEETKKEPDEPKEEGWAEKAKKLIDETDNFIDEKVDKVKKSKAFGEIKDSLDKAEEFGKKVAVKAADKLEDLAEGIRKKAKDEEKPEDPAAEPQK